MYNFFSFFLRGEGNFILEYNWKFNRSATLGTSGDIHGSRVYFSMTGIVFLVLFLCSDKFDVDGNRSRC